MSGYARWLTRPTSTRSNYSGRLLDRRRRLEGKRRILARAVAIAAFRQNLMRDGLQVPYQTHPRQDLENVVGHVDFPPVEALACGAGEAVMVVVPAFTHGDERQYPVVT